MRWEPTTFSSTTVSSYGLLHPPDGVMRCEFPTAPTGSYELFMIFSLPLLCSMSVCYLKRRIQFKHKRGGVRGMNGRLVNLANHPSHVTMAIAQKKATTTRSLPAPLPGF